MKFSLLSVATMAASVFAAPLIETVPVVGGVVNTLPVGDVVNKLPVGGVVNKLPVGGLVNKLPVRQLSEAPGNIEHILSNEGLVQVLTSLVATVKTQTGSINQTVALVKESKLTKAEGITKVVENFSTIHVTCTEVVTKVTGAVGVDASAINVGAVLSLVLGLVGELVATVKSVTAILGASTQLQAVLHSVFSIVSSLLSLLVGLIAALLPDLTSGLSPLLSGLTGNLAGVLSPVVGLLGGLGVSVL